MGGRKFAKTLVLLLVLAYCSLLIYQSGVGYGPVDAQAAIATGDSAGVATAALNETATPYENTTLNEIFISVKTTKNYENTRLPIILQTWFQLAKEQIWFFTDTDNTKHQNLTNGHMINTNCSDSHQWKHLCCKMSVEYDYFLQSGKKWFCHFDDDNYVNVPRLLALLQRFNPAHDYYLGRTSIYQPVKLFKKPYSKYKFSFWFATGGAGFCLSRSLAYKMIPIASGGRFISICEGIRLPDDVSIGFIAEHLLKTKLTVVEEFHSHLEQMKFLRPSTLREQVSLSYARARPEWNVLRVPGFDKHRDPTRFLSLHCFLFPNFKDCPR